MINCKKVDVQDICKSLEDAAGVMEYDGNYSDATAIRAAAQSLQNLESNNEHFRVEIDTLRAENARLQAELAALRADIEAENKPLTIGELYSMRKKPVWLVYPIGEAARWTLLAIVLDESMIYDSTHFVFEGTKRRYVLDVEDYGKKWLPYRAEQAKEETHGTSDK